MSLIKGGVGLSLLAVPAWLTAARQTHIYRLPAEPVIILPVGKNAELAQAYCSACHSLDYVVTQPRGKGAQYWRDNVTKMVTVYGAPIEPADADRIAAYLGETYGKAAE